MFMIQDQNELSKKIVSAEIVDKMVYDFLDLNYRLVDISHKYEVNYQTLRHLLLSRFDSKSIAI